MSLMDARYELPCVEGKAAFTDPQFPPVGGSAHSVVLELQLAGLVARLPLSVYTDGGHTIVDFFAELAAEWKGWDGGRSWYDDGPIPAPCGARRTSSDRAQLPGRSDMAATLDDAVTGPGHWLVEGAVRSSRGP